MPTLTHRATAVIDVPQHVEYRSRTRAIRNDEQDQLPRYLIEYVDTDYEVLYYHTDHDTEVRRSTAQLAVAASLSFRDPWRFTRF